MICLEEQTEILPVNLTTNKQNRSKPPPTEQTILRTTAVLSNKLFVHVFSSAYTPVFRHFSTLCKLIVVCASQKKRHTIIPQKSQEIFSTTNIVLFRM